MNVDPLIVTLQSDLLANIIEYAADLIKCSETITSQIREIIGARIVALFERDSKGEYNLLAACPHRKSNVLNDDGIRRIVAFADNLKKATLIEPGKDESGMILSGLGMKESFIVPLRVQEQSFGILLLLDLMDLQGIQKILEALEDISGLLSLVFKNSFLYRNMESLVDQRTRALQESELRSQIILQTALDGYLCIDPDGNIIDTNDSFSRMIGYSRNELLQMTIFQLAVFLSPIEIKERIDTILDGQSLCFEAVHQRKDGGLIYLEISSQLRSGSEGKEIFSFLRDITDRKRAEEEKEKMQAQLTQAQKMEAIGTLAGGIAHDFNNILGAILGYAELAREDSTPGSEVANNLDQVLMAGNRAKDLAKQILSFSRQADTDKIPLQPETMVKETVKLLRSSLPTTIDIKYDTGPDVGLIFADPIHIHQILVNLCTNAYHAMEETTGTISISVTRKVMTAQALTGYSSVKPGDFMDLSIRDNGSGIRPEIMDKIFDPYFTTKEMGKGTGMGLAIVHGIMTSYGGFITCKSKVGEGTVFDVFFPSYAGIVDTEKDPTKFAPRGTENILVIDDEKVLAEMAQSMLERIGYKVTVRTNSIEALSIFQNQPEAFDLVITDQTMPEMTGFDVARRMLQIRPDLPIILCTGYSSQISEEKVRAYGIKGFAMKPLSKNDIATLVRRLLDDSKSIPS